MFFYMNFSFKVSWVVCFFIIAQIHGSLTVRDFCEAQTKKQLGSIFSRLPLSKQIDMQNPDKLIPMNDCFNTTALVEAVKRHDHGLIIDLLAAKADPNVSGNSKPLLSYAVMYVDNESSFFIVKRLLSCGASPSKSDNFNMTPLHYACCKLTPFAETIRCLLKHGADYSVSAEGCGTPYQIIASKGSLVLKDKLHFLQSMMMFRSYQRSQDWKSSPVMWDAFWEFVDGCPDRLVSIVKNNPAFAQECFTQEAIKDILKNDYLAEEFDEAALARFVSMTKNT